MKPDLSIIPSAVQFRRTPDGIIAGRREVPAWMLLLPGEEEILEMFDGHRNLDQATRQLAAREGVSHDEALEKVTALYDRARIHGLFDPPGNWMVEGSLLGFYYEVTHRCNLECSYCCAGATKGKGDPGLSTAGVMHVLDTMARLGGCFVVIGGGEPLTRPDVFEILRHASSLMPVSLVTNGTLIDDETAEALKHIPGLSVRLSLDGATSSVNDQYRHQGSFHRASAGLGVLFRHFSRENLSLSVTITSGNVQHMGELYDYALNVGVGSLVVTPLTMAGRASDIWGRAAPDPGELYRGFILLRERERSDGGMVKVSGNMICAMEKSLKQSRPVVRCPVGQRPGVDPRGWLYPCSLLMKEPFRLGNIAPGGDPDILLKARLRAVASSALSRRDRTEECRECFWKGYCSGGCMARAWQQGGSLNLPDPDCSLICRILDRLAVGDENQTREKYAHEHTESAAGDGG